MAVPGYKGSRSLVPQNPGNPFNITSMAQLKAMLGGPAYRRAQGVNRRGQPITRVKKVYKAVSTPKASSTVTPAKEKVPKTIMNDKKEVEVVEDQPPKKVPEASARDPAESLLDEPDDDEYGEVHDITLEELSNIKIFG